MIGRGAQGRPWLFNQVSEFITANIRVSVPSIDVLRDIILSHLDTMYRFYGERIGVRVTKKHLAWYCESLTNSEALRYQLVRAKSSSEQMQLIKNFFDCRL